MTETRTQIPRKVSNPGVTPMTDTNACSYSDVAASRLPSPRQEEKPAETPSQAAEVLKFSDYSSSESKNSQDQDSPWTTVQHRQACSLDSAERSHNKLNVHFTPKKNKNLSTKQLTMVKAAEKAMTGAKLKKITCRQDVINAQHEKDPEPGPSINKGKGIDPLEWGNTGLSKEELNVKAQWAAIEAYNAYKEKHQKFNKDEPPKKRGKTRNSQHNGTSDTDDDFSMPETTRHKPVQPVRNKEPARSAEQRASSRPAAQLAPKSSLGAILSGVAERYKSHRPSESGNSSEGEPSSSDSESYYSDQSLTPSEHEHQKHRKRKRTLKKCSQKS